MDCFPVLLQTRPAPLQHGLAVPPLYGSGPGRYGGFYTKEDVREICRHAAARGVEVVPEIDVPGRGLHSSTFQLYLRRFGHTSPCPSV
jgi:hexosaminidase